MFIQRGIWYSCWRWSECVFIALISSLWRYGLHLQMQLLGARETRGQYVCYSNKKIQKYTIKGWKKVNGAVSCSVHADRLQCLSVTQTSDRVSPDMRYKSDVVMGKPFGHGFLVTAISCHSSSVHITKSTLCCWTFDPTLHLITDMPFLFKLLSLVCRHEWTDTLLDNINGSRRRTSVLSSELKCFKSILIGKKHTLVIVDWLAESQN